MLEHYFNFHKADNIELINMDFLKYDIPSYDLKFISNLPYNVGTAIIQKILPLPNWSECVFMLQKEVVQRLAGKQGTADYGYISIFTKYYAHAEILFDVSPKCFSPRPLVNSSVIKLINKRRKLRTRFFPIYKAQFSMRRKTILNCISSFKK